MPWPASSVCSTTKSPALCRLSTLRLTELQSRCGRSEMAMIESGCALTALISAKRAGVSILSKSAGSPKVMTDSLGMGLPASAKAASRLPRAKNSFSSAAMIEIFFISVSFSPVLKQANHFGIALPCRQNSRTLRGSPHQSKAGCENLAHCHNLQPGRYRRCVAYQPKPTDAPCMIDTDKLWHFVGWVSPQGVTRRIPGAHEMSGYAALTTTYGTFMHHTSL